MGDVNITPFRRRILAYLDQKGPSSRIDIMCDLSPEGSTAVIRAIPQSAARLVGAWAAPLIRDGLVRVVYSQRGFYQHHEITDAGRRAVRELARA